MKKITGKQRLMKYAYGGGEGDEIPIDPNKKLTAKQIREKYKGNPYVTAGRETWGQSLDATFPLSGGKVKVRDAITNASNAAKISPSLLYTSAMEEGLGYALSKPNDVSEAYVNWSEKNADVAKQFQVDGFYNYGLDTFGDQYKDLMKKGYLPEGFDKKFTVYPAFNEKKQKVNTAAFMSDEDALTAKAAMIRNTQDYLDKYSTKNKVKLTDKQKDFFTLAGYNAGLGNMEKMIKSYADKGYLKDDNFLDPKFKPASYADVYTNVQRRLQNRNILETEGFFATGGEAGLSVGQQNMLGLVGQIPGIADALISVFENDPRAYSRQPTLNADTMRQMVTPYSHFAMGGELEGLDEQTLMQLQAMADENGITIEELLQQLQEAETGEEEMMEEEPMYGDESDVEQFAYGGKSKKGGNPLMAKLKKYAMGGNAVPIEVEDNEVIQTPDGKLSQIKGATHEEGGIDVNVPKGTKIYSDRLKIDGKTMQERKVAREKALNRIERMLVKNPGDKLLQGSYERTLATTDAEESQDMALQKFLNSMYNAKGEAPDNVGEFAMGGKVKYALGGDEPYFDKTGWHNPLLAKNLRELAAQMQEEETIAKVAAGFKNFQSKRQIASKDNIPPGQVFTSDKNDPNFQSEVGSQQEAVEVEQPELYSGKPTLGDFIGMGGNLFNAVAPILNTVNNAAGNKPNINRYLGFGREALETNEQAQGIAGRLKSTELTDIETAANTARLRNRGSVQSVNTLRALDAITDMGTNKAKQAANDSFSKTMMNLLGQRGQLENIKDRMEMAGEERRDIEDKADRDNFYSNMAQNLTNFGTNIQGLGKSLNVSKSNQVDSKLISQLSQYGLGFDEDGNLITVGQKKG